MSNTFYKNKEDIKDEKHYLFLTENISLLSLCINFGWFGSYKICNVFFDKNGVRNLLFLLFNVFTSCRRFLFYRKPPNQNNYLGYWFVIHRSNTCKRLLTNVECPSNSFKFEIVRYWQLCCCPSKTHWTRKGSSFPKKGTGTTISTVELSQESYQSSSIKNSSLNTPWS